MIGNDDGSMDGLVLDGGIGHPWVLPIPSSSWYCVDGVVVSADVLPHATPIGGRVTAARQEIRRQMRADARRLMQKLMDAAPEDNTPTPRGEGDE